MAVSYCQISFQIKIMVNSINSLLDRLKSNGGQYSEEFKSITKEIRMTTIDHLKVSNSEDFKGNSFKELFRWLNQCVATGISEQTIRNRQQPAGCERSDSDASEISTSSNEDKPENASETACKYFLLKILDMTTRIRFLAKKGNTGGKLGM